KPRREPQQERSRQMRDDILEASIRVLASEGPLNFTTLRVAEVAGISVGSLYQYFPNKDALVYALHTRMVDALWQEMQHILDPPRLDPRTKVQRIARMFFLGESDQMVTMGNVLADIDPFFDTLPELQEIDAQVLTRLTTFVGEVLPDMTRADVAFGAQMLSTTIESVGKSVAKRRLSSRDLRKWATSTADMVCDHLGFP
ncbi:MAG: TetR/AcrR family transcriptional regulator, partial [Candidatus Poribacteria bacterium]